MKLMKFPVMAGSAFTSPHRKNFYLNVKNIYEIDGAGYDADAVTIKFLNHGISDDAATTVEAAVTIVMDGTDGDEKVENANKLADYLANLIAELVDSQAINKHKVYDLIPTLADIHTKTGITKTGGSGNDAIISITLS